MLNPRTFLSNGYFILAFANVFKVTDRKLFLNFL